MEKKIKTTLPTLEQLGLKDRRHKVPEEIKKAIKEDLDKGITGLAYLARKYNVSVCVVRYVRDPEHERAIRKKSLDKCGGPKAYYNRNKAKHKQACYALLKRKNERIKQIVEEYSRITGEDVYL